MDANDLSWRFDVRTRYPSDQRWRPFTAEHFPQVENNSELGIHEFPCLYEADVVERLHHELDNALPEICGAFYHTELTDVRILLWRKDTAEGDPDMILEATQTQLQTSKLRSAAFDVAHAERQLREARRQLRRVIAEGIDQTDAETVFTETETHLPDEDLVAYLAGARLLQRALFHPRSAEAPSPGMGMVDEYDAAETGHNYYWRRISRFGIDPAGSVTVEICPSAATDDWGRLPDDDPEEEKRLQEEERAKLAAIARAEAETLLTELAARSLKLTTADGQPAGVDELASRAQLIITA